MRSSMNTLRIILVAGAVLAMAVAAVQGAWPVVLVLAVGVTAHAAMWLHMYRHTPPVDAGAQGR